MTPAHTIRGRLVRILRSRVAILALLISAAYLISSHTALAHSGYSTSNTPIPNFGVSSCQTCHTASPPTLISFGTSFKNNAEIWNATLATADSDGDGFTNGEELQDPTGALFNASSNKTPGDSSLVSNPGVNTSYPPIPQITSVTGVSNGGTVSGNVTFGATLKAAGVSQVGFVVKNAVNATVYNSTSTDTNKASPYTVSGGTWDSVATTGQASGNFSLIVTATDHRAVGQGGPRTVMQTINFTVDNSAPPAPSTRYVARTGADSGDCKASAAPCATLQYAVNQANDTDEVRVATGVYTSTATEVVNVGTKAITLTGGFTTSNWTTANPAVNSTIIDGENARQDVYVDFGSAAFTIQGFIIRHGLKSPGFGGGLFTGRNNTKIINNRFENNVGYYGGGAYIQADSVLVNNNIFMGNNSNGNDFSGGGGIHVFGSGVVLSNNRFESNSATGRGGAVFLEQAGAPATLTNNIFLSNSAVFYGGAINTYANATIINALFVNNTAGQGAVYASQYLDRTSITYATIAGTSSVTEALYLDNQTKVVTLTNTLISGYNTGITIAFANNAIQDKVDLRLQNVLMANDGANNVVTPISNAGNRPVSGTPIRAAAGYVGGGNYHLAAGAFAIDKGVATPGITTDLDGDTRPIGSAPDIGMDEFVPIPSVPPTVSISATDASAAEQNQDVGIFTVTRGGDTSASLTVNYSVTGSAIANTDYATLPGSVTISPGQTSATITVTPFDDGPSESAETVVVTLTANAAYTVGSPNSATVTIADNDNPIQTASVVASDLFAAEHGQDAATFTITRNGSTASALTVKYIVSGTATPGSDYNALTGSLTIPAGQASATITITPIDDAAFENIETVTLTLTADAAYIIGSPSSQTITIIDNDGTFIYLPLVIK